MDPATVVGGNSFLIGALINFIFGVAVGIYGYKKYLEKEATKKAQEAAKFNAAVKAAITQVNKDAATK